MTLVEHVAKYFKLGAEGEGSPQGSPKRIDSFRENHRRSDDETSGDVLSCATHGDSANR